MENQNEALTRQLHDSFSADQFSDCLAMAADDVRINAYAFNMNFNGKQEFLGFMQGFKQAFPDMKIRYRNVISQDNKVAVEFTAAGTHTGPLQTPAGSIPPTGKSVELDVVELLEWDNGKLKNIHNYQDAGSLMRQIGAM